jgi:LacI family transcriptional regulator
VPDDIAVIGAGDIAHGDLLRVPLTTVGWSKEDLGRRAAELIFEQIGAREEVAFKRIVIPPHLVVRESCGAGKDGSTGQSAPPRDPQRKRQGPRAKRQR